MSTREHDAQLKQHEQVRERVLSVALLLVVLAVGAALRFTGLDWDEGVLLHPDERFLAWVAADLEPVDSLAEYFDTTTSTLNPNNVGPPHSFFVYGTVPVFLGHLAGELTGMSSLYTIYMPGRVLSAVADLLTVVFVFLTARRLFDWRAGVLASALYAFAALPVQLSHFFAVDTFTTMFAMGAFWFAARTMFRHRWLDYPLFGLMLGLAMASKLSIAPLAVVLIVAIGIRVSRELVREKAGDAPIWPAIVRGAVGLVIAGIVTVLVFRVGQPYAFLPPGSGVPLDAEQLGPVMTLASRLGEPLGFRPNPDWLRQMREVQIQVSGGADIPPNHQWAHRAPFLFAWQNMVRVGLGWPLGLFAWLAFFWALWEIARGNPGWRRLVLPMLWTSLLFSWQSTAWVKTMRYFLPVYPTLMMLAGWALVTLRDRVTGLVVERQGPRWHWSRVTALGLAGLVLLSALAWSFAVTRIYTRPHTRIAASRWIVENVPGDITLFFETADGPRQLQLGLRNDWPVFDPAQGNDPTQPYLAYSYLAQSSTYLLPVNLPFDGTLVGMRLNHVVDPFARNETHTLRVRLVEVTQADEVVLAEAELADTFEAGEDMRGDSYTLPLAAEGMREGGFYRLELTTSDAGALVLAGATVATEGQWDDAVPLPVPGYDIWGSLYQPLEFNMAWEDLPEKRLRMQYILDNADYITISSNRFYDSLRRIPERWPMSLAYYEALFSGELGFELVADFTSPPTLGPITFNDLSAEEAWTVYDHPRVMVWRKTEAYSPARTAEILNSANIEEAAHYLIARDARERPRDLPLPEPRHPDRPVLTSSGAQTGSGGSAAPRWNLFASAQPLGVVAWWLAIGAVGWLAFPALWALLPGLPDRGYPLARVVGLLFAAWLAWLLASVNALPWARGTMLLALAALAAGSLALIGPRREAFAAWLRENRRHLLIVEAGLATLFLLFVLIRLGNPDLWHPAYGGEKPMDLAYLNAVLRSESFPPYDPWFAGETINYYYFGFVIVGLPLKLLGVPTTVGYNLVLPTLFALTGGAAFSAAFNLVAPLDPRLDTPGWKPYVAGWQPYIAGGAAVLLAIILGNLDQIRTLLWGLAELAYGAPRWAFDLLPPLDEVWRGLRITLSEGRLLPVGVGEWYWNATRVIPVPIGSDGAATEVQPITEFPFFTFLYADLHAHMIAMPLTLTALGWAIGTVRGARLADGLRPLRVLLAGFMGALVVGALRPTNTWDYPTYLALAAAAIAVAVLVWRDDEAALPALAIGGLGAILGGGAGFALAAGTPTALPIAGGGAALGLLLGYGVGLAVTRAEGSMLTHWLSLLIAGGLIALFAGATALLYLPYIQTYRLGYDQILPWEGSRTPLWAYLDIHGLFLFIIASWLVLELWRWLGGRLNRRHTMLILLGGGALIALTAFAATRVTPVAAAALPLLAAALALFLRHGQAVQTRFVLVLLLAALSLTLLVEVVVLAGDLSRMNTVFKFYLQVWLLLAIVAGVSLAWLLPALRAGRGLLRAAWLLVLAGLVALAGLYTLTATRAKVADRWNPNAPVTLDGMAYMPTVEWAENGATFSLRGDYEAIRWLQTHVEGHPVMLEGLSWREYLWGNRVSVYTGLPSVIGWNWHQRQQRGWQQQDVWQRIADVNEIYNTTDLARAQELLRRYGVELIVVGELERAYYDPAGLAKFEAMAADGLLDLAYEGEGTAIYRVREAQSAES